MTRLLKHGAAGNTLEIVAVSWIEKPWGRPSRCMALRMPPDLGVWLTAGAATAATTQTAATRNAAMRNGDMLVTSPGIRSDCRCAVSVREKPGGDKSARFQPLTA